MFGDKKIYKQYKTATAEKKVERTNELEETVEAKGATAKKTTKTNKIENSKYKWTLCQI